MIALAPVPVVSPYFPADWSRSRNRQSGCRYPTARATSLEGIGFPAFFSSIAFATTIASSKVFLGNVQGLPFAEDEDPCLSRFALPLPGRFAGVSGVGSSAIVV